MKAAVFYKPQDIRVEDMPNPTPKSDNIILQVECCAICGSDLKLFAVGNPRCKPPRIIGHEMAGSIVHVGTDVEGFAEGERVTLATTIGCGQCYYCCNGRSNLCIDPKPISNALDGAFAEYIEIPFEAISRGNVIKLPDNVTNEEAALSEPLSCAINGQELSGVKKGDSVLIYGGGPLGVIHAKLALALGVKNVMVAERSEKRLELLSCFDDIYVIDTANENTEAAVKSRTEGFGADIVIVCAPVREAHEQAISCVKKGGTVCFFASIPKEASNITIDSRVIHYGEIKITGVSDSRPEHVQKAVKLMSEKKIDLSGLITHRISLDDFHKGLDLMRSGDSLKVLVYPKGVR